MGCCLRRPILYAFTHALNNMHCKPVFNLGFGPVVFAPVRDLLLIRSPPKFSASGYRHLFRIERSFLRRCVRVAVLSRTAVLSLKRIERY